MISIVTLTEGFPCCNDKKKRYTRGLEVGHYDRLFDFVRNFIFLYLIMLVEESKVKMKSIAFMSAIFQGSLFLIII